MSGTPHTSGSARVPQRNSAFDLMRFLCAMLVMISHSTMLTGVQLALPHATLCVDTFFMISGCLLCTRFGPKFAAGVLARDVAFERLVRILPIAYAGLVFGLVAIIITTAHPDGLRLMLQTAAGMAMIPFPSLSGQSDVAPIDFPFWTLIWEVWLNLVLIFGWRRLNGAVLASLISTAGVIVLSAAIQHGGLDFGTLVRNAGWGAARAGFAFCIGVSLAKFVSVRWTAPSIPTWAVLLMLLAVLAVPMPAALDGIYEVGAVALLLPVIVSFAAAARSPAWLAAISAVSGQLYYGVYAFHAPALRIAGWLCDAARAHRAPWLVLPVGGVVLLLSYLASRSIDPWAQRRARILWASRTPARGLSRSVGDSA